jgi:hypothetical protein
MPILWANFVFHPKQKTHLPVQLLAVGIDEVLAFKLSF